MATETMETFNGWYLEALHETIAVIEETPEAGRLKWRSHVTWDGHFGVDAHTDEIEQLGQVLRRKFTIRGDHPPELLGENTGPTAVETLLAALGSCMAGTYAAHAAARGIAIDRLEVELESANDLTGFLQLDDSTPAGLERVQATIRVESDADDATLDELRAVVTRASPVFSSVSTPVPIDARVERAD
jgi:uncharacterized OsmC-like protein